MVRSGSRPIESVSNAHSRLTEALRPPGWAGRQPHYNGAGFRPHITGTDDRHARLGDQFNLGEIAIVEMLDPPIVRAIYTLSDPLSRGDLRHRHTNPLAIPRTHGAIPIRTVIVRQFRPTDSVNEWTR